MNTYPIKDAKGQLYAIEVDSAYVGTRRLAHLISTVEGVSDTQARRPFSRSGDVRATFRFLGSDFRVVEPFGDNSRYWIGPANDGVEPRNLSPIDKSLRAYKPSVFRRLVGNLVTFNFRSLFGG